MGEDWQQDSSHFGYDNISLPLVMLRYRSRARFVRVIDMQIRLNRDRFPLRNVECHICFLDRGIIPGNVQAIVIRSANIISETAATVQELFVILKSPNDPASIFTMNLGEGRVAACVFSRPEHAMLFAMNAQGLDATGVTSIAGTTLREDHKAGKLAGVTHVLLDPSAGAGATDGTDIDEFIAKFAV